MKNYINILLALVICTGINACSKKEEALTPSNIDVTYHLPQGNNAFDQTIKGYFDNYGTFVLYKFNDRDAYWTPTSFKKPAVGINGFWSTGVDVVPSNTDYVALQLDLLDKSLFSLYPSSFLKQFLPIKLLLCSKVDSVSTTIAASKTVKKIPAYYSYDNITVNYGDASISQMTAAEKLTFLARINQVFFQNINERALIKPIPEFVNSADYTTSNGTAAAAYAKGIVASYTSANVNNDWNAYIMAMVTLSEADLNRLVSNTINSPSGVLNPAKDVNGLIRKRYNIVRNYFINTYQVDLQKIGNKAKGF
ncbi:putative zinc-binding metallopeptidase [Mucilaginibacter terrae]|uniref:Uncharacterized protein n=1 Tax=Mucilaginibacter terrae TaxID=1955052 RepID=A0ABU3GR33_9SPHI|nr:putative zinc-binding metallopeptidase [Mucilaginibacter terrae]MDT3402242.1 hypothetical protein [Mucilaginibacter terrae]